MGRIADALARAESRRAGTRAGDRPLRSMPLSGALHKWSQWYGAAEPAELRVVATAPNVSPTRPPGKGMSPEIVCYHDRASTQCEQYRSLRTRLISDNPKQDHRVYGITSTMEGEGKSVTAANLGFSLAEIRHLRVLIVDADFRASALAGMLGMESAPGLAELLREEASLGEVIRPTPWPNLFFLPPGHADGRSAPELLSTRVARATFRKIEREFQYSVVDTPPVSIVSDAGIIGQMTSGMIFVVRMNRTPEPMARRAVGLLTASNVPIVGCLLVAEDDCVAPRSKRNVNKKRPKNDDH